MLTGTPKILNSADLSGGWIQTIFYWQDLQCPTSRYRVGGIGYLDLSKSYYLIHSTQYSVDL